MLNYFVCIINAWLRKPECSFFYFSLYYVSHERFSKIVYFLYIHFIPFCLVDLNEWTRHWPSAWKFNITWSSPLFLKATRVVYLVLLIWPLYFFKLLSVYVWAYMYLRFILEFNRSRLSYIVCLYFRFHFTYRLPLTLTPMSYHWSLLGY